MSKKRQNPGFILTSTFCLQKVTFRRTSTLELLRNSAFCTRQGFFFRELWVSSDPLVKLVGQTKFTSFHPFSEVENRAKNIFFDKNFKKTEKTPKKTQKKRYKIKKNISKNRKKELFFT